MMKPFQFLLLAGSAVASVIPEQELLGSDSATQWESNRASAGGSTEACNPLDFAIKKENVQALVGEYVNTGIERSSEWLEALGNRLQPSKDKKPNMTIYQLITTSQYTTKLAALISDDEALVKVLNGTAANYTLFAPIDKAFEKIPKHGHKPSKEFIRKQLLHHASGDFYPAGRVLKTYTIPTLRKDESLGGLQRLTIKLGLRGLTVNYLSKVVAIDVFATNGVIHGIDSFIIDPPPAVPLIEATPQAFSTLALGLTKTGLLDVLKKAPHVGGTFFAPNNNAFVKLGPRANAFLFSKYGQKYLKAILKYHVVFNSTLYSDAYYESEETHTAAEYYHLDLPTLLEGRSLPVDVSRVGPFISIRANGYARVIFQDAPTKDGVIQVVGSVLVPPKKHSAGDASLDEEELTVSDLMERLEPYIDFDDALDDESDESFADGHDWAFAWNESQ